MSKSRTTQNPEERPTQTLADFQRGIINNLKTKQSDQLQTDVDKLKMLQFQGTMAFKEAVEITSYRTEQLGFFDCFRRFCSYLRLQEYLKYLAPLLNAGYLKKWPSVSGNITFGDHSGRSALDVAIKFSRTVLSVATEAAIRCEIEFKNYTTIIVSPVVDKRFGDWHITVAQVFLKSIRPPHEWPLNIFWDEVEELNKILDMEIKKASQLYTPSVIEIDEVTIEHGSKPSQFNNSKSMDILMKANGHRGKPFPMSKDIYKQLKKRLKAKLPQHSFTLLDMMDFNKDKFKIKKDSPIKLRFVGFREN